MFNRTAVAYSGAATVAAVVETVAEAAVAGVAAAQEQFEAVEPADIVGRPDFLGKLAAEIGSDLETDVAGGATVPSAMIVAAGAEDFGAARWAVRSTCIASVRDALCLPGSAD